MIDIRNIHINELKPAPYNPRLDLKPGDVEYEKLKRSIQEFGLVETIVYNERSGYVVGGHQRLKVLQDLGYEEVPVSVVNLSDNEEKALNVALNKISGDWDMPSLKDLLTELDAGDYDVELTGFGMDEIESLMTEYFTEEDSDGVVEEDDYDNSDVEKEGYIATTKNGDIWQLGRHRLMCGDSTSIEDAGKLMNGVTADMVFTDPPYGYEYQSNARKKSDKFDVLRNDDKILDFFPVVAEYNKGFVFVCTTWKVLDRWIPLFKEYHELTNLVVWDKGGGGMGDLEKTFSTNHEIILVSHEGNKLTDKRIGSVWSIGKDAGQDYIHATQKPVALPAHAIKHTTNATNNVLDLFGGSGSTLMAAEQTNRNAFIMELDEKYCDGIINRWEQYTGDKAVQLT